MRRRHPLSVVLVVICTGIHTDGGPGFSPFVRLRRRSPRRYRHNEGEDRGVCDDTEQRATRPALRLRPGFDQDPEHVIPPVRCGLSRPLHALPP